MSKLNFDKTLSVILIIVLIIAVAATIYIIVFPQPGEKFTEFYILGSNGKAGDYPTNLTAGESGNVTIGIVNHEYANTTYQLKVVLNKTVLKDENITLANNEKKEIPFTFKPSTAGNNQKLEFLLYKLPDTAKVYRSVYLYLNVTSS
jgi:uncharacterized membrane protein